MKKFSVMAIGIVLLLAGCANTKELEAQLESYSQQGQSLSQAVESLEAEVLKLTTELESASAALAIANGTDQEKSISGKEVSYVSNSEANIGILPDYPLLDVQVNYNDSDLVIIIADYRTWPENEYFYTNSKQVMQRMQTDFQVYTFPKGRGTTPNSVVYIYEDNVLIREIPFIGGYDNHEGFELESLNKDEIKEIIGQELLPPC